MTPEKLAEMRIRLKHYQKLTDLASVIDICSRASHGTMADLAAGRVQIGLRHDMDMDFENALRMAEWEHSHGIRSTYYPLHTDWYYHDGAGMSAELAEVLDRIADMGHEIGLHNNVLAVALTEGRDPVDVLKGELALLRSRYPVTGTAAHGHPACKEADVINWQVFAGTKGARHHDVRYKGCTLKLEPLPMESLGLAYEAYHVPYDLYLSDNGGNWSPEGFAAGVDAGKTLAILMHPVHWVLP